MAVTKIRKISSWTLLICALISIVVLGMFYAGGAIDPAAEMKEPVYTGLLLNWTYLLFIITVISTVLFAIWQFVGLLKADPKAAIMSLVVIVLFVALLFITYSIGSGDPLQGLNADSQKSNVPFWLKITDMWIYSTYTLIALIVLSIIVGSVKRVFNK